MLFEFCAAHESIAVNTKKIRYTFSSDYNILQSSLIVIKNNYYSSFLPALLCFNISFLPLLFVSDFGMPDTI